jgi:predicted RecA/RadA family phage recombinase
MATIKQAKIKNTRELAETNKASGVALDNGEILAMTAGLAVPADSGTVKADLLGVCNEDIAIADAKTRVLYIVPSDEDTFIFPTTNNSDADHNGQAMVLTNSTEVNNTGTTDADGIIQQVEPYGAAADKLIIGRFLTL